MELNVLCEREETAEALAAEGGFDILYSWKKPASWKGSWMQLLPYIIRPGTRLKIGEPAEGVLIRGLDGLGYLRSSGYNGRIRADACLYSMNALSHALLLESGVEMDTLSYELNFRQMQERGASGSELVIFGRVPLMISANCLEYTGRGECGMKKGREKPSVMLTDRKKAVFPCICDCRFCYNIIYNSVPLSLHKEWDDVLRLDPSALRLCFTVEEPEEAVQVLRFYKGLFSGHPAGIPPFEAYTKGHFRKGVS